MNSTDKTPESAEAARALSASLTELGEQYRRAGRSFFPLGASSAESTYFVPRKPVADVRAAFEAPVCRTSEELSAKLAAQWSAEGLPELAALAPQFAQLAEKLRTESAKQPDELSPFLYAMF